MVPRPPLPPPIWVIARDVPEYQLWVKQGSLDRFAQRHSLDASFVHKLHRVPAKAVTEFENELAKIPKVQSRYENAWRVYRQSVVPVGMGSLAQAAMAAAEGWDSNSDDQVLETSAESETVNRETVSREAQPQDTRTTN
jgi:hypothetical protein